MSYLIVIEGLDGSGTTTQTDLLVERLLSEGYDVLGTYEPRGPLEPEIRDCIDSSRTFYLPWYFAAARAWHLANIIEPELQTGRIVVCDRYYLSSLAYQAINRSMEFVWSLNKFFRRPHLTICLNLSPEECVERMADRATHDPFETLTSLKVVAESYRHAIEFCRDRGEVVVELCGNASKEQVHDQIWRELEKRRVVRKKAEPEL